MLFNTWTFLAFFAIVYPVYLATQGTRLRVPWLCLASYVFYAWWHPAYVLLIAGATTIDYWSVVAMTKTHWKKPWLALSIASNLGLLAFFKYAEFAVKNLNAVLRWVGLPYELLNPSVRFVSEAMNGVLHGLGLPWSVPALQCLLPVGVSFFVFRSLTYTIEVYRGQVKREPDFIYHAAYVAFFPQLVMGPIERASNLLPQLRSTPRVTRQDLADGVSLFVVGLFKKIALADYLAAYVDRVYASPGSHGAPALLLATVAYAWQIYFDFSGYSDMARGIGRLMGFRLVLNFNNPYLATGLGEFWQRWHISLSTWFKDFVYVPLGGNRRGELRTYVNMVLTMLLSGLWHGALWTFVVWGAIHAAGRVITRELERTAWYRARVPKFAKQLLTFGIVTLAWVFFRAPSVSDAWLILRRIVWSAPSDPTFPLWMGAVVLSIWVYQSVYESRLRRWVESAPVKIALVVGMVVYMAAMVTASSQAFIYLQF